MAWRSALLIVTPANLSFQWQRELKDKFRENFEIIRSDILRANYGSNPWQEKNQVITSVSWVSRIEDAKESLLRSHWDLIIVDEAHKMSAFSADKKTLAYQLGESLSAMTDHYLLMTATPHKGNPENFCLFLSLLDKDVYGDVKSLEEAMTRQDAPFYLRRVKEALVSFPDPETGQVKALFTKRIVKTSEFAISADEYELYDQLVVFQKWRWTEIAVTLGLIFVASMRKEWPMTFIAVRCPHCQSDQIVQRGKTARGTQRYLCQNTLCTKGSFLLDYCNRGCLPEVKQTIIDMSLNASGVCDTARSLHICPNTVLRELKKKETALELVNTALLRTLNPDEVAWDLERAGEAEAEMDEMWSFVGNKGNPRWLWHAIDHHTGKVLTFPYRDFSKYGC